MSSSPRQIWIDIAKGAAILLVVLLHASDRALVYGELPLPITAFNAVVGQVRMPLFFFCSGLVYALAAVKGRPLFGSKRMVQLGYLYLVWCLFFALFNNYVTAINPVYPVVVKNLLLAVTLNPTGPIWFVMALMLATAFSRGVANLNTAVAAALCVLLFVVGSAELTGFNKIDRSLSFVPFFWIAARFGTHLLQPMTNHRARMLVAGGAAFALLSAVQLFGMIPKNDVLSFACAAAGIAAAVGLAGYVARLPQMANPLLYVGRRSLPIFLLHAPMQSMLFAFTPLSELEGSLFLVGFAGVVIVPVFAAIAAYEAIRPTRFGVLIDPPKDVLNGWVDAAARTCTTAFAAMVPVRARSIRKPASA